MAEPSKILALLTTSSHALLSLDFMFGYSYAPCHLEVYGWRAHRPLSFDSHGTSLIVVGEEPPTSDGAC
jgi:hypothetical protein